MGTVITSTEHGQEFLLDRRTPSSLPLRIGATASKLATPPPQQHFAIIAEKSVSLPRPAQPGAHNHTTSTSTAENSPSSLHARPRDAGPHTSQLPTDDCVTAQQPRSDPSGPLHHLQHPRPRRPRGAPRRRREGRDMLGRRKHSLSWPSTTTPPRPNRAAAALTHQVLCRWLQEGPPRCDQLLL
uniref:Uncharacterized protein n=1 Tax=Triticum urartu TaxID=4572 RepID=A0A8R7R0R8_TRIUA